MGLDALMLLFCYLKLAFVLQSANHTSTYVSIDGKGSGSNLFILPGETWCIRCIYVYTVTAVWFAELFIVLNIFHDVVLDDLLIRTFKSF